MNMITPITADDGEQATGARKRRLADRPLWQRLSLVALPVVAVGAGVSLFNRGTPAVAAPPPPTVTSTLR